VSLRYDPANPERILLTQMGSTPALEPGDEPGLTYEEREED